MSSGSHWMRGSSLPKPTTADHIHSDALGTRNFACSAQQLSRASGKACFSHVTSPTERRLQTPRLSCSTSNIHQGQPKHQASNMPSNKSPSSLQPWSFSSCS